MPASTRVPVLATRQAAWGLALLVLALCLHVVAVPQIGLPLTALALLVGVVVVSVLALTELERDVVHMALLGAVLGGCGEAWLLGRDFFWHGALFGLLVGALVGDEVQLSRKWLKLTRQAKAEARWWQKLPLQAQWLPRVVWTLFAMAVAAALTLPWWLPFREGSELAHDFFAVFRERRLEASLSANVLSVWFAIVPLCIAIALSRFVRRVPNQALLVDGLLRRIAVLQCAALLMLAANALAVWTMWPVVMRYTYGGHYVFQLEQFVDMLRLALIPCMLLMLSQIFLGKRMLLYWRRSGWIVALGGLGWTTVGLLGLLIVHALDHMR